MVSYPEMMLPPAAMDQSRTASRKGLIGTLLGVTAALLFLPTEVPGLITQIQVGDFRLRIFDFVLGLWLVPLGLAALQRRSLPSISITLYFATFVALGFYAFCNNIVQLDTSVAVKELIQTVEFILFVYLLATFLSEDRNRQAFFDTFLYCLIGIAVANAALHVINGHYLSYKIYGSAKLTYGLVTFMVLLRLVLERRSSRFMLWLALFGVCFLLMILSSERKGWVAVIPATLAVSGVIAAQIRGHGTVIRHRLFMGAAIGVPLLCTLFPLLMQIDTFSNQLMRLVASASSINAAEMVRFSSEVVYESNLVRAFLLEEAYKAFVSHPLFGLGAEGLQRYIYQSYPEIPYVNGAHNEYVGMAVEYGSIGFVLYVATWLLLLRDAVAFSFLRHEAISLHDRLLFLGMTVYGAVVCMFLAASALTIFYLAFPIALGLALRRRLHFEGLAQRINRERSR